MAKQFHCRICQEPSEFGLCEKHLELEHNLAKKFAPKNKNYTHKIIALGWCITDATKALTEEDMKAIEEDD